MGALRIKALRDGFRRAGIAHPAVWTEHPAGTFDADQIATLRAEAMLLVEDVAVPAPVKDAEPETAGSEGGQGRQPAAKKR